MYDVLQFSVTPKFKEKKKNLKNVRAVNNFAFQSDHLFSTTSIPRPTSFGLHFFKSLVWTEKINPVQQLAGDYLRDLLGF